MDLVAPCAERVRSVSAQPLPGCAAAGPPESIAQKAVSAQTSHSSMECNEFQSMKTDELRAVAKNLGVPTRVEGTKKWRTHTNLVAMCAERVLSVIARLLLD